MNNTCILCPQFFDWYSIREKVSNFIFIFHAISLTSVGKPPCFLHFLPCLHMALSYQTVSKTLTKLPMFEFQSVRRSFPRILVENSEAASFQKTRSRSTRFATSWPTRMTSPTCLTGCFPTWSNSLSSLDYDTPVCLVYGTTMLLSGMPTGLSRSFPT